MLLLINKFELAYPNKKPINTADPRGIYLQFVPNGQFYRLIR
jgi:hypothetical protein